jgi:phage tail P2-like protein
MNSLLPLNSTPLERALERATDDVTPVPLRALYNPDTCPTRLLPYLAWECSVDRWDWAWPESIKRAAIRSSFYIHAHKGTIGALRRVVEPLGYLIDVLEWWETRPMGVPGTFGTTGRFHLAASVYDGDEIDVYPPASHDINVGGSFGLGGREISIDAMEIFG